MSTENAESGEIPASRKRKRPYVKDADRKNVSRACDACKDRKVRCAGTQPCPRCVKNSCQCTYNSAHRRGKPSPPEPGVVIDETRARSTSFQSPNTERRRAFALNRHQEDSGPPVTSQSKSQEANDAPFERDYIELVTSQDLRNPPHQVTNDVRFEEDCIEQPVATQDPEKSLRNPQEEADGVRFEEDYIGPTSGIAFLHRAQKRFQQDYASIKSKTFEGQGTQEVSVFSYGDGWVQDASTVGFSWPSPEEAKGLFDRYFEFAMPTYRFLNRPSVESWLESISSTVTTPEKRVSNSKKAIVILIMATAKLYNENVADIQPGGHSKQTEESSVLFTEAERLLNGETGPVRIESVQARLAQSIYLLASSRINQAWYSFGTATQMISALGLHRKPVGNPTAEGSSIAADCRKRVFWSAYTLDRYLSVILGRPRIFRDEDIDQSLPERLDESNTTPISTENKASLCVSDAPVYHARLAKIIGAISSDLYPTSRAVDTEWLKSAGKWTATLKEWKESLPAFLDPTKVDPSMLVPIFQRQSTVLRLAYAHALILANRPSLLNNFADLNRRSRRSSEEPTGSLKECIDAAMEIVVTVNELIGAKQMRKAFWFTHYISFCGISALYIYTIQQYLPSHSRSSGAQTPNQARYFETAMKCQQRIEETTTVTSPFRRYNIILDELKKEVIHHMGLSGRQEEPFHPNPSISIIDTAGVPLMESSGGTSSTTPTNVIMHQMPNNDTFTTSDLPPINSNLNIPPTFNDPNLPQQASSSMNDSIIMDLGAFGLQGELMGWSEFDSCAINWPEGWEEF